MIFRFTDTLAPITDKISSGGGDGGASATGAGIGGIGIAAGIIVGILILSVIGAFVWFYWSEKKKWNLITRVHYENPAINGVSIGHPIPTRRVRFKDGKVCYLYKYPIQGYTISPELMVWTRPREHDVIVTQDKKLFCVRGIEDIDVKRKKLNVEISYPDIEMDRQDLQNHIDSKKYDDPNEKLKTIAKVSMWVFFMVTAIVLTVLGGKYYLEGKEMEMQRDKVNSEVTKKQVEVMESLNKFMIALDNVIVELDGEESAEELNVSDLNNTGT
ncbi:MAG: hypothetical protein ACOCRX_04145 [Candidatus Woesearchaeota archaeon]